MRHGHAEVLFPMIERVMQEAGLAPAQLDAVAVATGPGGFTGIRVGLAAAHGIALALGARLVGITSFRAVAARVAGIGESECDSLLVALDSRRADLYVQLFARGSGSPLAAPQAVLEGGLDDYLAQLIAEIPTTRLLVAGDACERAASALAGRIGCIIVGDSAPNAQDVAAAALSELRSGAMAGPVRPLYLRPPDVTVPKPRMVARSR